MARHFFGSRLTFWPKSNGRRPISQIKIHTHIKTAITTALENRETARSPGQLIKKFSRGQNQINNFLKYLGVKFELEVFGNRGWLGDGCALCRERNISKTSIKMKLSSKMKTFGKKETITFQSFLFIKKDFIHFRA